MSFGRMGAKGGFAGLGSSGGAGWWLHGAALDMDFANGRYYGGSLASLLSITRASSKTDLLPTSASGATYSAYLSNVGAINASGFLIEEARTNVLLNSTAPVTQTTASLGTGTYTLWVNGSGSATSSAGSATITGGGAATNGTPNVFVVTVAGTVTITKSGSLNAFQCELGAFGTSLIVTAGATGTRAADNIQGADGLSTVGTGTAASFFTQTGVVPSILNNRLIGGGGAKTVQYVLSANQAGIYDGSAAINTAAFASGSFTSGGGVKVASGYNGSGRSLVGNNGTVVTDASATQAMASFYLGSDQAAGNFINTYVKRLAAWNVRLADATLKALTA